MATVTPNNVGQMVAAQAWADDAKERYSKYCSSRGTDATDWLKPGECDADAKKGSAVDATGPEVSASPVTGPSSKRLVKESKTLPRTFPFDWPGFVSQEQCGRKTRVILSRDAVFSHQTLDPYGAELSAFVPLPKGSAWVYDGGQESCIYPGETQEATWAATRHNDLDDEEGHVPIYPSGTKPWSTSYLEWHAYRDDSGAWVKSKYLKKALSHEQTDSATL